MFSDRLHLIRMCVFVFFNIFVRVGNSQTNALRTYFLRERDSTFRQNGGTNNTNWNCFALRKWLISMCRNNNSSFQSAKLSDSSTLRRPSYQHDVSLSKAYNFWGTLFEIGIWEGRWPHAYRAWLRIERSRFESLSWTLCCVFHYPGV